MKNHSPASSVKPKPKSSITSEAFLKSINKLASRDSFAPCEPVKTTPKREQPESIDLVKEFYKYNDKRAQEALSLLSEDQLVVIEKKLAKGGVRNGR